MEEKKYGDIVEMEELAGIVTVTNFQYLLYRFDVADRVKERILMW